MRLFKPKFLIAPETDLTLVVSKKEIHTEQEIQLEVTPPFEQQVISQIEIRTTFRIEKPSESDSMPLVVLETLKKLNHEN